MATVFDTDHVRESISLAEFVDYCEQNVDVNDYDQIMALAPMLKALANNRQMLIDSINKYFRDPNKYEDSYTYTAQSLILESRKNFYIRTNTWSPPASFGGNDSWERNVYSYDYAHNHNFNLLTVGYFGTGYYTDIYDLDHDGIHGYAGERVDFEFQERINLSQGKVLFYHRAKDIHVQLPPDSTSVSLNFMPLDKKIGLTEQFAFNLKDKTISELIGSQVAQQVDLMKLAECIGDSNTLDIVLDVAMRHPNRNTRLGAFQAASNLRPSDAEKFWTEGLRDKSDMIRQSARAALAGMDSSASNDKARTSDQPA